MFVKVKLLRCATQLCVTNKRHHKFSQIVNEYAQINLNRNNKNMFKVFTKNKNNKEHENKKAKSVKDCSGDPDCPMCHISPETLKTLQQPATAKQKDCCS